MYDVFISHASENKDSFVRKLAGKLVEKNIAVWYDEFSLHVGDSLRESLDTGLRNSRFGIVVLSVDFLRKPWTTYELDGLTQLENAGKRTRILPIWLDVDHSDILEVSPSLANKVAIKASLGVDYVVRKLLEVVKPESTSITIASEILVGYGYEVPPANDEWWLDVVNYDGGNANLVDWPFNVGYFSDNNQERGELLARKVVQMIWQDTVSEKILCQITPPQLLLKEIRAIGGLVDLLTRYLETTVIIAPQLVIPGCGGEFEEAIEFDYQKSLREFLGESKSRGKYRCDKHFAFRDPLLGNYSPVELLEKFIVGRWGRANTPYEYFDYLMWLLSDKSLWLPKHIRDILPKGFLSWDVWIWHGWTPPLSYGPKNDERIGSFSTAMHQAKIESQPFLLTDAIDFDVSTRVRFSIERLDLPESVETLKTRFYEGNYISAAIDNHRRNHLTSSST